jgi:hypothetical protein
MVGLCARFIGLLGLLRAWRDGLAWGLFPSVCVRGLFKPSKLIRIMTSRFDFLKPTSVTIIVNYTTAEHISLRATGPQFNGNVTANNVNIIGKEMHDVVITVRRGHGEARGSCTARVSSSRFL